MMNILNGIGIGTKDNFISQKIKTEKKKKKPTARRKIILIRHGQYNSDGKTDEDKYLTPLGKEQAELTGQRLKSLGLKISTIYESTMTRAKQTSDIIKKHFPDVEVHATDMLREG